jgi:hypothetical protein
MGIDGKSGERGMDDNDSDHDNDTYIAVRWGWSFTLP